MALWDWQELASLGELKGEPIDAIEGVCIDSRSAQKGDLFVALAGDPGPRFNSHIENPRDGHQFVSSAMDNGAVAAIVSSPQERTLATLNVSNTLDALWSLAALARHRMVGKTVSITGSAGKTTARSWLMRCLEAHCEVHGSIGSLNNHWGVPLSLSRMPRSTDVGVFEVGTNHEGEILPLSQLVKADVAVLLNVLPAHIGNFPSFDHLRQEKLSIGTGASRFVVPIEYASGERAEISFGLDKKATVSGKFDWSDGTCVVNAVVAGKHVEYQLHSGGEHLVLTSLAVLSTLYALEVDFEQAIQVLAKVEPPLGRGNVHQIAGIKLIDDSYNANPVSMNHSLDGLSRAKGRTIALLGEIRELGDATSAYHRDIADRFNEFDRVLTVGDGFAGFPAEQHFETSNQIDMQLFGSELREGDTLLVKGSNAVFWQHDFVRKLVQILAQKKAR